MVSTRLTQVGDAFGLAEPYRQFSDRSDTPFPTRAGIPVEGQPDPSTCTTDEAAGGVCSACNISDGFDTQRSSCSDQGVCHSTGRCMCAPNVKRNGYILDQTITAKLLEAKFDEQADLEPFYKGFKSNIKKYEEENPEVVDTLYTFIDF